MRWILEIIYPSNGEADGRENAKLNGHVDYVKVWSLGLQGQRNRKAKRNGSYHAISELGSNARSNGKGTSRWS